jgi:hypothetical protein
MAVGSDYEGEPVGRAVPVQRLDSAGIRSAVRHAADTTLATLDQLIELALAPATRPMVLDHLRDIDRVCTRAQLLLSYLREAPT